MGANIDFNLTGNLVPPLEDDQDTVVSFNLPRKITNVTGGRAVADGAVAIESTSCTYEALLALDRMRLLSEASLVLTPYTYKEGVLYSLKPTYNGNGDFTVTRATTATRVNSAGLVDLVPYNLVGYSEMFTDASWTKSNVTISANSISAPNGTLTADTLTSNGVSGSHGVLNGFTPVISTTYTLSCYVKANTNNFVQITAAASAFGSSFFANFDIVNGTIGSYGATALNPSIENVGSGWYRISVSGVALTGSNVGAIGIYLVSSNSAVRLETNTLSTSVFIWGAQLVEGTSARDYLRTETRLNIPRVDYSLGGCPNILLEPQRTNLALHSSSFDSATWAKSSSTITANSTTSPSGIVDADTITSTATSTSIVAQAPTIVSGTTYTLSFYAKQNTQRYVYIRFTSNATPNNYVSVVFDLQDGTVGQTSVGTTSGTLVSATTQSAANGFYRLVLAASINVTDGNIGIGFATAKTGNTFNTSGSITSAITSGNSFFIWGAQLEAGAYATSFIPTTTPGVTRNADSITRNNIFTNGLITASGGTWFVELRNNVALLPTQSASELSLGIGATSNGYGGAGSLSLWNFSSSSSRIQILKQIGGVFTVIYTTTTDTTKIAIKWNGATADVFANGVKVVSATAFAVTNMDFFFGSGARRSLFVNETALFPTPLTDAQMSMLTSGIYPTAAAAYASLGLVSESPSCLTLTTTF